MRRPTALLGAFDLGAAAMYLLDPDRGGPGARSCAIRPSARGGASTTHRTPSLATS